MEWSSFYKEENTGGMVIILQGRKEANPRERTISLVKGEQKNVCGRILGGGVMPYFLYGLQKQQSRFP